MRCFESLVVGFALIALCFTPAAQADPVSEVVILPAAVEPERLRTVLGATVMFRNRSGRPIEVQFVGYQAWHHVSETPKGVAVVFHQTGRHPFVVRFPGSDRAHVHGVVEIDAASGSRRSTPVCSTIRVEEVCLEP